MLMRAGKSFYDIHLYISHRPNVATKGNPLTTCLPSKTTLFAFVLVFVVTRQSERFFLPVLVWDFQAVATHVAVGAASLALLLATIFFDVRSDKHTHTHTHTWTNKQTNKQATKHTHTHTHKWTNKQTNLHKHTHAHKWTNTQPTKQPTNQPNKQTNTHKHTEPHQPNSYP